jgi:GAF domain-containing protein
MPEGQRHARVWFIWGLVAAFAVIEAVAWVTAGGVPRRPGVVVQVVAAWVVMLLLAWLATQRIGTLAHRIREHEHTHEATLDELEQLQTQNAILDIVARSVDVAPAFQALASRIARLVPCDRVGLALLSEDGRDFQTYTARVQEEERRARPRPDVVFKVEQTVLGNVLRSREPFLIRDLTQTASEFLDINVLQSAGFGSALLVPLVSRNRAVGSLNVVSRSKDVYQLEHAKVLEPIAEILAVAVTAQQLQLAYGRYRSMEAMSELTLAIAVEINGALQAIIGNCDLIERTTSDPSLKRDIVTVVRQAQRIAALLDKMRTAATERLREVEAAVSQAGIPSSPEAFGDSESLIPNP